MYLFNLRATICNKIIVIVIPNTPIEIQWIGLTLIHYKNDVNTENCFKMAAFRHLEFGKIAVLVT